MRFLSVLLLCLASTGAWADGQYDASKGTLPQAQGFAYTGDTNQNGTNPSPYVANSTLYTTSTVGGQYWQVLSDSSIDFSQHVVMQASLKIDSSNYISNIGTGTREGYYLIIRDQHGSYSVGLADSGFNINSIGTPNQALTPFPLKGISHTYRLEIENNLAAFYIDGTLVANNVPPQNHDYVAADVLFGGAAGLSRSSTELTSFAYTTSTAAPKITAFSDRNSWQAVTAGLTTIGFEGIAPQGGFVAYDNATGLVQNGVTFTGLEPPSGSTDPTNYYLRVVDPLFQNPSLGPSFYNWNSGALLHGPPIPIGPQSEGGPNSHIHVALPSGVNSVGSDIMSFLSYASPFTVVISTANGNEIFNVNSANYPMRAFTGFTANVPIQSLDLYALNGFPELDNFSFGAVSTSPTCQYSLSSAGQTFNTPGGFGSVAITTSQSCTWSAVPNVPWITALPATFSGASKVLFVVAPNTGSGRSGYISIAGIHFNIDQSGFSCSYTISPATALFGSAGGSARVAVSAPAGCTWNVTSGASWLTASPLVGSGSAAVSVNAAPSNSSTDRSSFVTIAGQVLSVLQSRNPVPNACGASNVTSEVNIYTGPFNSHLADETAFTQNIIIQNGSGNPIKGPIYYVTLGLTAPSNIGVISAPLTYCFSSIGDSIILVSGSDLAPFKSLTFSVDFVDSTLHSIGYTPILLSGAPSK